MPDKVFGSDFTNETSPTSTSTVSVNNGTTLVDVQLSDLVKAFPLASLQILLDLISTTQGVILYYNGTDWVALSPGTSGQVLKTAGAGGNPSWGLPADLVISSQAQGDILYFNGTNWVRLAAGTAGQFLKTAGASANPSWANAGGESFLTRYIISPSVASNNLTVALKYLDGNDPTATNRLIFRVGNTEYTVTAATSYTKNAGTNWHNMGSSELAAQDVDLFLYAIGETGASAGLKFGHSRISHALTMGDFVNTTTSEKYIAGNWTNFNATDPVTVIGRFRARLSAGAGYTWSIPTSVVVNAPIYDTSWLVWTPTLSGAAPLTYTVAAISVARYKLVRNKINVELSVSGTLGGTAGIAVFASAPFTGAREANNQMMGLTSFSNAVGVMGVFYSTATRLFGMIRYDFTNLPNAGTLDCNCTGFYEM